MPWTSLAIWIISLAVIALILIRPKAWPEAAWATAGAVLLVICGLVTPQAAFAAVSQGTDVYLFLTGMMIVSELARREGVFDWLARHAVEACRRSQSRLFLLIYATGIVVTVLLSNDATAVVLTPAVLAAVRAAGVRATPYLFACAFIANAASFVLPISNPANLVVYGESLPPLIRWMFSFGLSSIVAIAVTFAVLRWLSAKSLREPVRKEPIHAELSSSGRWALLGIAVLAVVMLTASAFNVSLGAPALATAVLMAAGSAFRDRRVPRYLVAQLSWSVLPLVAGLFVIVQGMNQAGALRWSVHAIQQWKQWPPIAASLTAGFAVAGLSNVMNNLPSGLIAGSAIRLANPGPVLRNAVLIAVDLGPNLSVTGSLATILWLIAIRREGEDIGFWKFLKWGLLVMPPALLLALLASAFVS